MLPLDGEAAFLSETAVKSSLLAKPASASTARDEFFATVKQAHISFYTMIHSAMYVMVFVQEIPCSYQCERIYICTIQ
jgi:hypothetical protein